MAKKTKKVIDSKFPGAKALEGLKGHLAADYDKGVFSYEYPGNLPILTRGRLGLDIAQKMVDEKREGIVFESFIVNSLKLANMDYGRVKDVVVKLEEVLNDLKVLEEQLDNLTRG